MKLKDKSRLSWHNIKQNKSRSIITLIIVYIIGLMVMGILAIAISFVGNMNAIQKEKLESQTIIITHSNAEYISLDEYNLLKNVFNEYQKYISNIKYAPGGLTVFDFNYFTEDETEIEIIEGEKPSSINSNTNNIYLNLNNNQDYHIGDEYILEYGDENYTFLVAGFYENKEIYINYPCFVDITYYVNNIKLIRGFSLSYDYQEGVNVNKCIRDLNKLKNEISSILPDEQLVRDNLLFNTITYAFELDEFFTAYVMNYVIIGIALILGVILVLMSIGSISNTLTISIDKNKKFFGLLKALGLKNRDVLWIVLYEGFFIIFLGSIFAFVSLLCFSEIMKKIVIEIVAIVLQYSFTDYSVTPQFVMPLYVGIINVLLFTIFAYVFSRTSLNNVYKNAPLKIINEVE